MYENSINISNKHTHQVRERERAHTFMQYTEREFDYGVCFGCCFYRIVTHLRSLCGWHFCCSSLTLLHRCYFYWCFYTFLELYLSFSSPLPFSRLVFFQFFCLDVARLSFLFAYYIFCDIFFLYIYLFICLFICLLVCPFVRLLTMGFFGAR